MVPSRQINCKSSFYVVPLFRSPDDRFLSNALFELTPQWSGLTGNPGAEFEGICNR
ncbi:hypothetical protein IQ238_05920 [Pleurocapsales cyanobacterium LEGE 06147]|nr:hypothetical protein [Pleurocapsales cyanobacterium LEGE 06147]